MSKPEKKLTLFSLLTLAALAAGCTNASQVAICDATSASRDILTLDLIADAGPRSIQSGEFLIRQIDEACR